MNEQLQNIIVFVILATAAIWVLIKIAHKRNGSKKECGKSVGNCTGCPLADKCGEKTN